MKLNFGKKFVLFIHWLLSLAAFALIVAAVITDYGVGALMRSGELLVFAITVSIVYLLFAAGSIAIIFSGRKKGSDRSFIIMDSSDTGRTRIAISAVEQMIRQAVRGIAGIVEMKSEIINGEGAISIVVDVTILNGVHVPTVTMDIRRAIRSYIELNCGVTVRNVSVSVHSLSEPVETGKRGRRKAAKAEAVSVTPVAGPVQEPVQEKEAAAQKYEPKPVEHVIPEKNASEPESDFEPVDEHDEFAAFEAVPDDEKEMEFEACEDDEDQDWPEQESDFEPVDEDDEFLAFEAVPDDEEEPEFEACEDDEE